jgi:D-tyrosyl-tRNA(Tyr) deacylase
MKAVIQRVSEASVSVDGKVVARIGNGMLILIGVEKGDEETDARRLAAKVSSLRIFEDGGGKTNLSISDTGGEILAVPQFTLAADVRRGRRPSFDSAADPKIAIRLFEEFVNTVASSGIHVERGVFGSHMEVSLINDGPFTIYLDSREVQTASI